MHTQTYVYYNDGESENVHALVLKKNEDDTLNLYVIRESGEPSVENGVPQGEGGRTWHT